MWIAVEQCSDSCDPFLHSGKYAQARRLLTEGLAIARQQGLKWPIGAGLVRLAKLAMAEGDFAEAAATLKESIPLLQSIARLDELGDAYIALATCLIHAGELVTARVQLREGLQIGRAIDHFATICHGLAASALLAAAEGNVECAVERNAAAVDQPFVTNSRWFADVYATSVQCAAAKQHGWSKDHTLMIHEILAENHQIMVERV
jgi:tetratricopeptide (TPR) repeat protein